MINLLVYGIVRRKEGEKMEFQKVVFKGSAVTNDQYLTDTLPEIVLAGRSNVGKSSFINSILGRKNVAYISSKPGKTQTLNFYLIDEQFYFVDVPGYGYAKVSKQEREKFGQIIEEYLTTRENLSLVVLLVDFRHPPSEDDILMYNYLSSYQIPCLVVATKVDKIPKTKRVKQERIIKQTLSLSENDYFITYSAITKENREVIINFLQSVVKE